MTTAPTRRGRPLTDAERRWLEQAEADLSPAASLGRIETTARLAFAAVVGATGLITTLGLTTTAREDLLDDPALLGLSWPVALLLASLLLAGGALIPSLRAVDLAAPSAVAEFYRAAVLRRGVLVLVSLLLLAVGLATALAAVIEPTRIVAQLSTTASTRGPHFRVSASASAEHLGRRPLTLVIRRGTNGPVLCRSTRSGAEGGAVVGCGPLTVSAARVSVSASVGSSQANAILQRGK